jgi:hypothetical protein
MRAKEFIIERKIAKPTKRQNQSTKGLHKFRDPGGYDRTYELNRVMMAAACSDGTTPLTIDAETYSGRYNTAHPYTQLESDMLKQAYKAVGTDAKDLNHGDLRSMELDSTNAVSPVIGFKGFSGEKKSKKKK